MPMNSCPGAPIAGADSLTLDWALRRTCVGQR